MSAQDTKTQIGRKQAAAGRHGRKVQEKPLGGYVRVSRVGERDERLRSPEFQAKAIAAKATAEGVAVRMFEPELDVSGGKKSRAILDELVEAIEAGELGGVIVYDVKRLSRLAPRDRIELVERIEGAGGRIVSCSEAFDTTTPEGRFVRDLFFSLARLELEQKEEAWQVAKAAAVERGAMIASRAPYGLRFNFDREAETWLDRDEPPTRLYPVAGERELVVELFEARAAGASRGELLELFEARTGRSSYAQTIAYMLRNRAYLGEVRYGGGDSPELVNEGAHEAIVDVDLFERVQRVDAERSTGPGSGGKAKSLLAGIATCAGCGRGLVCTRTGSAKRYSYKCPARGAKCSARGSIAADVLDEHVTAAVLDWAGEAADELVELELELGAKAPRIVLEHRLAEARAALTAYEVDVERELEVGAEAFAAGRKARVELVARREAELEAIGAESAIEVARTTLRQELAGELDVDDEAAVAERRRLFGLALAGVEVRRTPRRLAPVEERARVIFRAPAAPSALGEDQPELVEQLLEHAGA